MMINVDTKCSLFFGNATDCPISRKDDSFKDFCKTLTQKLGFSHLVIQHQVHSTDGWYIKDINELKDGVTSYARAGDYLITHQTGIGITVLTADCLPIVFYAPKQHVIAIAHAGWRGSVAGIAVTVLEELMKESNVKPHDLQIYFGPAAQACCYVVQKDFLANLEKFAYKEKLITKRNGQVFFDNSLLNKLQLLDCGLRPEQLNQEQNLCTICNHQFHSYRRAVDKTNHASNNFTTVWLK